MERHNVQATPFDLALLTAALDKPIPNRRAYYRQVYEQLIERIKLFRKTNERLAKNPELANIRLKVHRETQKVGRLTTNQEDYANLCQRLYFMQEFSDTLLRTRISWMLRIKSVSSKSSVFFRKNKLLSFHIS